MPDTPKAAPPEALRLAVTVLAERSAALRSIAASRMRKGFRGEVYLQEAEQLDLVGERLLAEAKT